MGDGQVSSDSRNTPGVGTESILFQPGQGWNVKGRAGGDPMLFTNYIILVAETREEIGVE